MSEYTFRKRLSPNGPMRSSRRYVDELLILSYLYHIEEGFSRYICHIELINASSKCKSFSKKEFPINKKKNYGIISDIGLTHPTL